MTTAIESRASSRDLPLIAGSVAIFAWSFGPLIVRGISASAASIIVFRVAIAVPVMSIVAYSLGGRITRTTLRQAVLPGLLFFGSIVTSFTSYQHTSIALATLIPAVQPALMMFIAPRLFGERSSPQQVFFACSALFGVVGVVLAAGQGSGAGMLGNVLAVMNLVLWTIYFVLVKRVRATEVHSWSFLASMFIVCACCAVPYGLIFSNDLRAVDGMDWVLILTLVLVPGLIGHGLMTWAARHLDLTVASLLTLGTPVMAAIGAWIIFDESLTPWQLVFSAVVLVSLAGIVLAARVGTLPQQTPLSAPVE